MVFRTYVYPAASQLSLDSTIVSSSSGALESIQFGPGNSPQGRGTQSNFESGGLDGVIGWTRWAGGQYGGVTSPGTTPANAGSPIIWGVPTATIPTSGTATYSLAGQTKVVSTDQRDITPGTLNSGTIAVNFATARMGLELGATYNGVSYVLSSPGGIAAPSVFTNGYFSSASGTAVGGSCTACIFTFMGFFAGTGASNAALAYSFHANPDFSTGLTGVAAFRR